MDESGDSSPWLPDLARLFTCYSFSAAVFVERSRAIGLAMAALLLTPRATGFVVAVAVDAVVEQVAAWGAGAGREEVRGEERPCLF